MASSWLSPWSQHLSGSVQSSTLDTDPILGRYKPPGAIGASAAQSVGQLVCASHILTYLSHSISKSRSTGM